MWKLVALATLVSGCLESNGVRCANGELCRVGSVCIAAPVFGDPPTTNLCVAPDVLEPCKALADGAECLDHAHRCYGGACLASGCGNGLVDPSEVCDDGNITPGDHCSADCLSTTEVCRDGHLDPVNGETCDDANDIDHDGCGSTCNVETPSWLDLGAGIGERGEVGLVYDGARDVALLFGGHDADAHSDTWAYDGRRWTQLATPIHPPASNSPAMVFDPGRARVVMVPGSTDGTPGGVLGETWEWDGATWTRFPPRAGGPFTTTAAMTYDGVLHRVVMFDGAHGWTWDGTTWTQVGAELSLAPFALGFDPVRGRTVLAGKLGGTSTYATFELVGGAWQMIESNSAIGIVTRKPLVWDAAHGHLVATGAPTDRAWNGSTWLAVAGATPLAETTLAVVVPRDGSWLAYQDGDTLVRSPAGAWGAGHVAHPARRDGASVALDVVGRRAFVFGGNHPPLDPDSPDEQAVEGVFVTPWVYDGAWHTIAPIGEVHGRSLAAVAFDPRQQMLVVFGGRSTANVELGDTWLYTGTWASLVGAAPPARDGAAFAYDGATQTFVLFGGTDGGGGVPLGDTWTFSGTQWTQQHPAHAPPGLAGAGMAFDPVRSVVVLFGGVDGGAPRGETWEWDGHDWTMSPATGPSPRTARTQLAYNPVRRRVTLVSGGDALDDVWEYDGVAWTQVALVHPHAGRDGAVVFASPFGDGIVSFDGSDTNGPTDELALLRWDGAVSEACTTVDTDGDGEVGCADRDCWSLCTPLAPPGVSPNVLDIDIGPHCGDLTCDPARETCTTCPADCTCAALCGNFTCDATETAATCPGDCTP